MVKKIITLSAVALVCASASAQERLVPGLASHKFLDNWSVGVNVGASAPLVPYTWRTGARTQWHYGDYRNLEPFSWGGLRRGTRLNFGVELTKQWSPVFSTGVEGIAYINTTVSSTAIDQFGTIIFGKANLSNLFFGYKGTPRFFELQARAGASWNYIYTSNKNLGTNFLGTKFGLDFDFNLGEAKAWTVSLKPSINYNLDGQTYRTNAYESGAHFQKNMARVELQAGLTYHFKTSNKQHYFVKVRPYDQSEIDGLNSQINGIRGQISDKDTQINDLNARIRDLQNQINIARNQKPQIVETVKKGKDMDVYVYFKQGKSIIERAQEPNVERIAIFMRNRPNVKVVIRGYASPEGPADLNQRLSLARAIAVKNALVKRYRISADRITTEGLGVEEVFSEPDWNRVAIGTLE